MAGPRWLSGLQAEVENMDESPGVPETSAVALVPEGLNEEQATALEFLDRLTRIIEQPSTRRAFLADPWGTLDMDEPATGDPRHVIVDTLADMSFEELRLVARFGFGIHGVLGEIEMIF